MLFFFVISTVCVGYGLAMYFDVMWLVDMEEMSIMSDIIEHSINNELAILHGNGPLQNVTNVLAREVFLDSIESRELIESKELIEAIALQNKISLDNALVEDLIENFLNNNKADKDILASIPLELQIRINESIMDVVEANMIDVASLNHLSEEAKNLAYVESGYLIDDFVDWAVSYNHEHPHMARGLNDFESHRFFLERYKIDRFFNKIRIL